MTRYRISSALATFAAIAWATGAVAQTPPPTQPQQQDQSEPKAASSPHQRDTTHTGAKEAPTGADTSPSSASTPHQQEATEGKMAAGKSKAERDRMMSDCMKKEQQKDSSMSAAQVKKTCTDQMKMQGHETTQR